MKRIFNLMLIAAMCCLMGCQPNENRVFDKTAAAGIAGTYTGVWSMVDSKGNTAEAQGTVVFAEVEGNPYLATMTIDAAGVGYSGSCKVNVAHAGDEYVYYNNAAAELLPADSPEDATVPQLQGRVKTDGTTGFDFKLKTGKGRNAKTTTYTFTGAR